MDALNVWTCVSSQGGVSISGRLTNSLSGDPIPNASVQIDELGRQATSDSDGTFEFRDERQAAEVSLWLLGSFMPTVAGLGGKALGQPT